MRARPSNAKGAIAMDVYQTPGAFSWSELTTPNPKAASEFYGGLFGWTFKPMAMPEGEYILASVGSESVGGLMSPSPGAPPMPPSWGVYVTVADCDASVAKAKSLGGQLCSGPFDVPGVGRMAVLQDPQGAVFSVMQYSA
jgi:uncharacterized protein